MKPDHHILPLLAVHFQKRFSQKRWAIYDKGRREAAIYENGHLFMGMVEQEDQQVRYSGSEEDFRRLWKTTIAIWALRKEEIQGKEETSSLRNTGVF